MTQREVLHLPIPGLTRLEDQVLRTLICWTDEHERLKQAARPKICPYDPPTTKRFSKHFACPHGDMLALLNRLQRLGLVSKRRRLSAGETGKGYDGALYSAVEPTPKARELVTQFPAP